MVKILDYEVNSGAKNMQIDSGLLESAIAKRLEDTIFRLYGWAPACVSLGRNQKDDFLDSDFLKNQNIDIVRRLTGGRALLHDREITYSYICPVAALENGQSVVDSYKEISQILVKGFEKLGIELEFGENRRPSTKFDYCMLVSTGADLTYKGKKLIGSAQFRKDGYILQHGSILLDYNQNLLEKIFGEAIETDYLTSIKEIRPDLELVEIISALKSF